MKESSIVSGATFRVDQQRRHKALFAEQLPLVNGSHSNFFFRLIPGPVEEETLDGFSNEPYSRVTLDSVLGQKAGQSPPHANQNINPARMVEKQSARTLILWLPVWTQILLVIDLRSLDINPGHSSQEDEESGEEHAWPLDQDSAPLAEWLTHGVPGHHDPRVHCVDYDYHSNRNKTRPK